MNKQAFFWIRICLVNLLIVALLGILMRYKMIYSFPLLQQKSVMHAHSHFAFAGWITQLLMVLLVQYLKGWRPNAFRQFRLLLWANLITAYGMLFSFPWQGYGLVSITFSTLNIFVAYAFAVQFWRQLNQLPPLHLHRWFKAALVFNVISTLGAFSLAFMMATKVQHQNWYLAAVYFYLHFQYNGWFFFACTGLLEDHLAKRGLSTRWLRPVFMLFAAACIPAFFLSALWLPISPVLFVIIVLAALAQVVAGYLMMHGIFSQRKIIRKQPGDLLMIFAAIALCIKLLLQLLSTIPSLSDLAFGFRPIVVGYLHLVLLGVISLFLLGYVFAEALVRNNRTARTGAMIFAVGIILNELLLMLQGSFAMQYARIPFMDHMLLAAGIVMFAGILINLATLKVSLTIQQRL